LVIILKRTYYLEKIRPYYHRDLIKALVGIRFGGKSTMFLQIIEELLESGVNLDHIININLENLSFFEYSTATVLNYYILSLIKDDGKYYIFLDEIKRINEYEKLLASLRVSINSSVFVSDSTSSLLLGKLGTYLVGRVKYYLISPLSYNEALEYCKFLNKEFEFNDYLKFGGFPRRFLCFNGQETINYISNTVTEILRYGILDKFSKNINILSMITKYVFINFGSYFSSQNIADYINGSSNEKLISYKTVDTYIKALENAFLISKVNRYDIYGKKTLSTLYKYYLTDISFKTAFNFSNSFGNVLILENIVYNELINQNYIVYVGKVNATEVDFLVIKNNQKCFVQVTYYLESAKTFEREIKTLNNLKDSSPKIILSMDTILINIDGIIHLNITDFLTHKVKLSLS
jgi:predicted AAA+ superfamily ATPase